MDKKKTGKGLRDGVYEAASRGFMGDVGVKVTIEEGMISDIEVTECEDTYEFYFYPFQKIPAIIKEYQTLNVDVMAGATFSSRALIRAVTDCVDQAGGDIEALKKVPGPSRNSTKVIEKTCDICVLGTGGSGSSAAAVAAENGAKVIVLEKAGYNGGITAAANCMLAVNSQIQLDAGVELPMDEIFETMYHWSHYLGNARLISNFLHETPKTVQWLRDKGIDMYYRGREQYTDPFECPVHFPVFADYEVRRHHLQMILDTVTDNGGEVWYETRAQELLKTGETVTGVRAVQEDGTTLIVHAKAVIVATGCYNGNKELADKYFRDKERYCMPKWLSEGDGLILCCEAGADTDGLGARVLHCVLPDRALTAHGGKERCITVCQMCAMPAAVFLNCRGHRFINEWLVHNSLAIANACVAQGDYGDYYALFNDSMVDTLIEKGSGALGVYVAPGGGAANFVEDGFFANMREELKIAEELGVLFSGDTPEELAEKLGMDPVVLRQEVDRYNNYCKCGVDEDYHKDPSLLHSMEGGKYYALYATANGLGSVGGVRIDDTMRVLTPKREAIPGLYCAGACAGGIWGNDSYGILEGATCSWSFSSGRMAGKSALQYALNKII